jgi:hypothetical protein
MMRNISTFLIVCLCFFTSCTSQERINIVDGTSINSDKFDVNSLLKSVQDLSSDEFEGRRTDTPGSNKAKSYIITKFEELGVSALGQQFGQPFFHKSRKKDYNGENILGVIKGTTNPESYIVLSAHFDHEGIEGGKIYNGADDNASGTSALFAFADYFKNNPPSHSIILAAFDAEELGLVGAKYFLDNSIVPLDQIKANINMDMISRSENHILWVVGPRYYEVLRPLVSDITSTEIFKVEIGHEGLDEKANWTNSSDHAAFHQKGIPFLFFTVDDHRDYHKPTDDFENINPQFYVKAVETIIEVFEKMDDLQF